jgi:hypothetical protein
MQEDSDASVTLSGGEDDDVSMEDEEELDEGAVPPWPLMLREKLPCPVH